MAADLGVDPIIATLLLQRGVRTFEEARRFFHPSLDQLHDPFLMKDMRRAVDRIRQAIAAHQRVLVYGDYDVDGTSAVALVYSFFQPLHDNIDFYIPDRDTEGSGISLKGIDYAHTTGVSLIIALDCGIKAHDSIAHARQLGIDVIVGDHHLPGESLPPAYAILDPKQSDCHYPYKELSGCGIGFKIVEAYVEDEVGVRLSYPPAENDSQGRIYYEQLQRLLMKYLDLVAVSIASDIVPMTGENRVLAALGLKVINHRPRPGIEAILHYSHVDPRTIEDEPTDDTHPKGYFERELTVSDLVFMVGPRINAAGRIHSAFDSVRLLLAHDLSQAMILGEEIDRYNRERKGLDALATEEAQRTIRTNADMKKRSSIVLYSPTWHKGIVAIVASRLVEEYHKPTIIFTPTADGTMYVGSARSFKEFDVHAALEQCADLLVSFGGHRCAAGVSLKAEHYEQFVHRFDDVVRSTMPREDIEPKIEIDAVISFSEHIKPSFLRILKQFAPFGPDNPVPVFRTNNLVDTGYPRIVGNKDVKHLKFAPIQFETRSRSYPAIGFQLGEYYGRVKAGDHFDICYQIEENFWRGKSDIQLNVKDIRFVD